MLCVSIYVALLTQMPQCVLLWENLSVANEKSKIKRTLVAQQLAIMMTTIVILENKGPRL